MRVFTIKTIFGKKGLTNRVYVIHDDTKAVYIGKTEDTCVSTRIAAHMSNTFEYHNGHRKYQSRISKLLFENHDDYFDWEVKVYTQNQAQKLIGKKLCCIIGAEGAVYDFYKNSSNGVPEGNGRRPNKCKC